jgi:hypothetical protein
MRLARGSRESERLEGQGGVGLRSYRRSAMKVMKSVEVMPGLAAPHLLAILEGLDLPRT